MISTLQKRSTSLESSACNCSVCCGVNGRFVNSQGKWSQKRFAPSLPPQKYFSPSYTYTIDVDTGIVSPVSSPRMSESRMVPPSQPENTAPGSKKGPWSNEEDRQLLDAYDRYKNVKGGPVWKSIERAVPTRDAKQCRERYTQNLDPRINHGPFTSQEEQQLKELIDQHGTSWAKISKMLGHTRSDNAIKNWYSSWAKKRKREEDDTAAVEHAAQPQIPPPAQDFPVAKRLRHGPSPSLQIPSTASRRWNAQSSLHRRTNSSQAYPGPAMPTLSPVDNTHAHGSFQLHTNAAENPPHLSPRGAFHYLTRSTDRRRQSLYQPYSSQLQPTPPSSVSGSSLPPPLPPRPQSRPGLALQLPSNPYANYEAPRLSPIRSQISPRFPPTTPHHPLPPLNTIPQPPLQPLQPRPLDPRNRPASPQGLTPPRERSPASPKTPADPSPSYSPSATRQRMSMSALLDSQPSSAGSRKRRRE